MEESLGLVLADVARLLRRTFEARAHGIGVTRPQWQVLATLARHEGCRQGELAEVLEVEPISLCRMVDRLQEAGLINRRRDPDDRRSWRLFLTERAIALLEQLKPLGDAALEEACQGLNAEERRLLAHALERMRGNLSRRTVDAISVNG